MARVPTNPVHALGSQPDPAAPHVPMNPASNNAGTSGIDFQTASPGEPTEDDLRVAADNLGLPYDTMTDDDREFLRTFASGALASLTPTADPDNPLIPGDPADAPTTPDPAATPDPDAAALETGADGAGVGSAPDEPGSGGTGASPDESAAASSQPVVAPAGSPTFEIPSALPPAPPAAPESSPQQEPLVVLPNGNMVPLSIAQQLLAPGPQGQQAQPGYAPPNTLPPPASPYAPQPTQQFPTPFGTEYVDERAGSEIQGLQQRLDQMQMQQQAENERQVALHRQSLQTAISETTTGYAAARGLTQDQADQLLDTAARLNFLGSYGQIHPNDPRRAVGAALEAAYWIDPAFRQHEIDRQLETQRAADAEVDKKRAIASSTSSTSGSVPRTAPNGPPRNRNEADAGIVAMIEADPAYQQQLGRRG